MLKAIHAQENKKAARDKACNVVEELRKMKLPEAAKKVEAGIIRISLVSIGQGYEPPMPSNVLIVKFAGAQE